jgi:hypothetical protein
MQIHALLNKVSISCRNKGKFCPDAETLKEFTCKYPELVFELLKFES